MIPRLAPPAPEQRTVTHRLIVMGLLELALRTGRHDGFTLTDFEAHRARFHIRRLEAGIARMAA